MLTKEENERLTQVGAGTPMGELLRRYWQPVGAPPLMDQDPVQPVRLLGEDLVLFRSEAGDYGLVAGRCAHRGLSLAYGVPQTNGLRCAYHGWTYDTGGRVVDMPFEPACLPLKLPAYPVREMGGLLWAYLGPAPAPILPQWDGFVRKDLRKTIRITPLPCSWLQCMDNSLDPVHFEHLHGVYGNYVMKRRGRPAMLNPRRHLKIDFDVFEYGIYKRRLVEGAPEDATDWTIGHPILFPNILAQGSANEISWQVRVPVDDTHTMHVVVIGDRPKAPEPPQEVIPARREDLEYDEYERVIADNIVRQDEMVWVGQGPVTDRSTEHLVTSDKGIMLYRKLLFENMEKVARGEDPLGVIRDPAMEGQVIEIKRGSQYSAFREGIEAGSYGGSPYRTAEVVGAI